VVRRGDGALSASRWPTARAASAAPTTSSSRRCIPRTARSRRSTSSSPAGSTPFAADYRVVRPDGSTLWLSGRGAVTARDGDGEPLRLISIMADVSETKQAERLLAVERERLRLALSAGQMGAYELDIGSDTLWWSPEAYALFGVAPATFTPTRESVIDLLDPDDRPASHGGAARRSPTARRSSTSFRIRRPDGSRVWIGYRGQAEYDEQGRPVRTFGVVMDISERKNAEQVLRDAAREKDEFIATLSHELRNPLAPIRNAVNALQNLPAGDPRASWCRDVIGRPDRADVAPARRPARRLAPDARAAHAARGAPRPRDRDRARGRDRAAADRVRPATTCSSTCAVETMRFDGDLTRLAQVFSNVLINAAKYTPARRHDRGDRVGARRRARRHDQGHRHRHRRRAHRQDLRDVRPGRAGEPRARRADRASACRWRGGSSSCTAERSWRGATASARAASSRSACRGRRAAATRCASCRRDRAVGARSDKLA
jgi:PAS domain S-box-containing protein